MLIQRHVEYTPAQLRTGELAAALSRIGAELFPKGNARLRAERTDRLPDGSVQVTESSHYSIYETVCSLGGVSPHRINCSWLEEGNGSWVSITADGYSKNLNVLVAGPSGTVLDRILAQLESSLRLKPPEDGAKRAEVAVGIDRDVQAGNVEKGRREGLDRIAAGDADTTKKVHISGAWAAVAALLTALGAVAAAILSRK